MSDAWKKKFQEKFPNIQPLGTHKCEGWNDAEELAEGTQYFDWSEVIKFISTTREEAKAEERERIWKKGKELITTEQLEIIIRNAKEENKFLSYAYVNAIMEGFVNKITEESRENTNSVLPNEDEGF